VLRNLIATFTLWIVFSVFHARSLHACGVSGADGVALCNLAEGHERVRPRWAISTGAVFTSTTIKFDNGIQADQIRRATSVSLAYMPTAQLTFQAGLGASLGGSLAMPNGTHNFAAGPAALLGASWLMSSGRTFIILQSLLTYSAARTQYLDESSVSYQAYDLRVGVSAGLKFSMFRAYIPVRVFGGPILWQYQGNAIVGTDLYHYQGGAGFAAQVVDRLNFFAEGMALGERSVSFGASLVF